jgi:hypothetical protein
MAYSKTPKGGEYSSIAQMVTMKEILAMSEYIRNFKEKYSSRKSVIKKKNK